MQKMSPVVKHCIYDKYVVLVQYKTTYVQIVTLQNTHI